MHPTQNRTLQVPAKHSPKRALTVTEYSDEHHVCIVPKSLFNEAPILTALQAEYPDHYIYIQDEGERWRIDLYPPGEKPATGIEPCSSTITLEVPYHLRLQLYAAIAAQVSALEIKGISLGNSTGNRPDEIAGRKYGDALEISAHRLRQLAKQLMLPPPGVDNELPREVRELSGANEVN